MDEDCIFLTLDTSFAICRFMKNKNGPANKLQLSGKKFGRLLVLNQSNERDRWGLVKWNCRCDCGELCLVVGSSLKKGNTKSCGCLVKESISKIAKRNATHGHTKMSERRGTRIYRTWSGMKNRCFNKNNRAYKYYGLRGIRVCKRWLVFENFLEDMGEKPEGLTLERKDNNKGYCPGNCVWATISQQNRNKRSVRFLTYDNLTLTIVEWERRLGLKKGRVYDWIRGGRSLKELIDKIVIHYE